MRPGIAASAGASRDDAINPLTVALLRAKIETELLAHHTGEKATYRMLLPMGRSHDGGNGRSFRSVQHRQHPSLLRARPAIASEVHRSRSCVCTGPQRSRPFPYSVLACVVACLLRNNRIRFSSEIHELYDELCCAMLGKENDALCDEACEREAQTFAFPTHREKSKAG